MAGETGVVVDVDVTGAMGFSIAALSLIISTT